MLLLIFKVFDIVNYFEEYKTKGKCLACGRKTFNEGFFGGRKRKSKLAT